MGISIRGKGKAIARERRHFRLRKKISGTAARPRLVVTRSARHMVAQVVDDAGNAFGACLFFAVALASP